MTPADATPAAADNQSAAPPAFEGSFIDSIDAHFAGLDSSAQTPIPAEPVTPVGEPAGEPDGEPDGADLSKHETVSWSPEAARRFQSLKSELKEYRTRYEEMEGTLSQREARLQELEAIANNPEFDDLRNKVVDYESRAMVSDLESSVAYRELITAPLNDVLTTAGSLAEKYSLEESSVIDALALTDEAAQDEALSELFANASDRDKYRVYQLVNDLKPIMAQRAALHENVEAALLEARSLEEQTLQQAAYERSAHRQQAAELVSEKLLSRLPFLTGLPDVDFAALTKEAAASDHTVLDDISGSYQQITSKLFPSLAKSNMALQREIDALTEQLAKYDKATPRVGGGSYSPPQGGVDAGRSFLDAVNAAFG